jgi:hypothetical protein
MSGAASLTRSSAVRTSTVGVLQIIQAGGRGAHRPPATAHHNEHP